VPLVKSSVPSEVTKTVSANTRQFCYGGIPFLLSGSVKLTKLSLTLKTIPAITSLSLPSLIANISSLIVIPIPYPKILGRDETYFSNLTFLSVSPLA